MEGEEEAASSHILNDEEEEIDVCIGKQCFTRPHRLYIPPVHYKRVPSREYRWKLGANMCSDDGMLIKIQRALAFPNCLGLSNDARWKWQWHPLLLVLGLKVSNEKCFRDLQSNWKVSSTRTVAYARIKAMSTFCGKLALRPVVELLPVPGLSIRRTFDTGSCRVTIAGSVEVNANESQWRIKVDWEASNLVRVLIQQGEHSLAVKCLKRVRLAKTCQAVATGAVELSSSSFYRDNVESVEDSLPFRLKLDSLKVSKIFSARTKRRNLPPMSAYLKASRAIGSRDRITIVPGHWIDPGYEPGAPGEREFNLEVANVLDRQLRRNGWRVLRPDRDAPGLSWEEYLNWVSKQSLRGTPVLEIHGQGPDADYRGLVLGVIGNPAAPLSQELSKDFGVFDMDWTDLAVPRRGGIILESFNSDEVLEMAPWNRSCAVKRLAGRILTCIERAGNIRGIEAYNSDVISF